MSHQADAKNLGVPAVLCIAILFLTSSIRQALAEPGTGGPPAAAVRAAHSGEIPGSILISSGNRSRGGFGDVASNVMMAEKLREIYPQATITVLVREDAVDLVKVLIPGYDPALPTQTINGLQFASGQAVLPAPDLALRFSAHNDSGELLSRARFVVTFSEYGWDERNRRSSDLISGVSRNPEGVTEVMMNSGAGTGGLYISPTRPSPAESRAQFFQELRSLDPASFKDLEPDKTVLGFTYTFEKNATQAYVNAAVASAGKAPSGKTVALLVKDFPDLKIPQLPANVRIFRYPGLSFRTMSSMIAHSDMPILVTGDVSLTQAIDFEKPFFYESPEWKVPHVTRLQDKLLNSKSRGELYWKTNRDLWQSVDETAGEMARRMFDSSRNQALIRSIQELRAESSLPLNLAGYLKILSQLNPRRISFEIVRHIFDDRRAQFVPEDLTRHFFPILQDKTQKPVTRGMALLAILASRQATDERAVARRALAIAARGIGGSTYALGTLPEMAHADPSLIELFQEAASNRDDEPLRKFARGNLAKVRELEKAQKVRDIFRGPSTEEFERILSKSNASEQADLLLGRRWPEDELLSGTLCETLKTLMKNPAYGIRLKAAKFLSANGWKVPPDLTGELASAAAKAIIASLKFESPNDPYAVTQALSSFVDALAFPEPIRSRVLYSALKSDPSKYLSLVSHSFRALPNPSPELVSTFEKEGKSYLRNPVDRNLAFVIRNIFDKNKAFSARNPGCTELKAFQELGRQLQN